MKIKNNEIKIIIFAKREIDVLMAKKRIEAYIKKYLLNMGLEEVFSNGVLIAKK